MATSLKTNPKQYQRNQTAASAADNDVSRGVYTNNDKPHDQEEEDATTNNTNTISVHSSIPSTNSSNLFLLSSNDSIVSMISDNTVTKRSNVMVESTPQQQQQQIMPKYCNEIADDIIDGCDNILSSVQLKRVKDIMSSCCQFGASSSPSENNNSISTDISAMITTSILSLRSSVKKLSTCYDNDDNIIGSIKLRKFVNHLLLLSFNIINTICIYLCKMTEDDKLIHQQKITRNSSTISSSSSKYGCSNFNHFNISNNINVNVVDSHVYNVIFKNVNQYASATSATSAAAASAASKPRLKYLIYPYCDFSGSSINTESVSSEKINNDVASLKQHQHHHDDNSTEVYPYISVKRHWIYLQKDSNIFANNERYSFDRIMSKRNKQQQLPHPQPQPHPPKSFIATVSPLTKRKRISAAAAAASSPYSVLKTTYKTTSNTNKKHDNSSISSGSDVLYSEKISETFSVTIMDSFIRKLWSTRVVANQIYSVIRYDIQNQQQQQQHDNNCVCSCNKDKSAESAAEALSEISEEAYELWSKYYGTDKYKVSISEFYDLVIESEYPYVNSLSSGNHHSMSNIFYIFANMMGNGLITRYTLSLMLRQFGPAGEFMWNFNRIAAACSNHHTKSHFLFVHSSIQAESVLASSVMMDFYNSCQVELDMFANRKTRLFIEKKMGYKNGITSTGIGVNRDNNYKQMKYCVRNEVKHTTEYQDFVNKKYTEWVLYNYFNNNNNSSVSNESNRFYILRYSFDTLDICASYIYFDKTNNHHKDKDDNNTTITTRICHARKHHHHNKTLQLQQHETKSRLSIVDDSSGDNEDNNDNASLMASLFVKATNSIKKIPTVAASVLYREDQQQQQFFVTRCSSTPSTQYQPQQPKQNNQRISVSTTSIRDFEHELSTKKKLSKWNLRLETSYSQYCCDDTTDLENVIPYCHHN